jgi:hypothetical protein
MREKEIDEDENLDPAMECIIAIEEQRLGRHLNPRETDDLDRRFFSPRNNGEYPPLNSQGIGFKARVQKDS